MKLLRKNAFIFVLILLVFVLYSGCKTVFNPLSGGYGFVWFWEDDPTTQFSDTIVFNPDGTISTSNTDSIFGGLNPEIRIWSQDKEKVTINTTGSYEGFTFDTIFVGTLLDKSANEVSGTFTFKVQGPGTDLSLPGTFNAIKF